jgi:hypothetical protein
VYHSGTIMKPIFQLARVASMSWLRGRQAFI